MPKHWLPLFDLAWEDGAFFLNTVTADKITATVRDEFKQKRDLTFLRAECKTTCHFQDGEMINT